MFELSTAGISGWREQCDLLLRALLHEWNACCAPDEGDAMFDMREYMHANLAEPLRLSDLAIIAGLSTYHFAREFRRFTGHPPMTYLRQIRVEAARKMLLMTGLPLREIASRVGFADEFQLSRVFKRITGQTPSAVRPTRNLKCQQ